MLSALLNKPFPITFYRKPGDDSKMLVCDICDKGYHTFCLKPAMTTIPKNGWKCKVCVRIIAKLRNIIDENLPHLSGIPDFLFARFFFFSGHGHRHISGSLNFIKNIFRICFGQAILIYVI